MARDISILIGTIGAGLWVSSDGGRNYGRAGGIWGDTRVYGLKVDPTDPAVVYAGTDEGIFRSTNHGKNFERLDSPMNSMHVWNIAVSPSDPSVIFAGTSPSALFRSTDSGASWEQLPVDMAEECPNVRVPRVTALEVDPGNPNVVWAGVEVDGVRRSLDGGDTWTRINGGLNDPDIHGMTVSAGSSVTVFTSTPGEVFASTDTGESWQGLGVRESFPMRYCRGITVKQDDPDTLLVATGDSPFGVHGAIQRSTDRGQSWERLALPQEPNTPMWAFATHASDPDFILCCSHYGQIYATADGGDWWVKLPREFSEVRGLAWTPN
jgi:photosystem II stability/assembly factor-like uncharacterized protein